MAEDTIKINSSKEFIQTIFSLSAAGNKLESGTLFSWYTKAKNWYDPNVCSCRKKRISEENITEEYKSLVNMSIEEKEKIKKWSNVKFLLYHNGEALGNLP
jgi:hypothetical protein